MVVSPYLSTAPLAKDAEIGSIIFHETYFSIHIFSSEGLNKSSGNAIKSDINVDVLPYYKRATKVQPHIQTMFSQLIVIISNRSMSVPKKVALRVTAGTCRYIYTHISSIVMSGFHRTSVGRETLVIPQN